MEVSRTAVAMLTAVLAASMLALSLDADGGPTLLTTSDVMTLPRPEADLRSAYGKDRLQFGELRLPEGTGPHPVAIVVHGGCWLAEYDLGYVAALAAALTDHGVATWSLEYRRVGDPGGGWPGTFRDVAAAADHLRELAPAHGLDLDRVVAVGHSAGGHLALWLAARQRVAERPGGAELAGHDPLPLVGVVSLAGIADLADYASPEGCGAAVEDLLGGLPDDVPRRTALASPSDLVPLGVAQTLLVGELDPVVPPGHVRRYAEAAERAGDRVRIVEIPHAGHFELTTPTADAWPTVRDAVLEALAPAPSLQTD